MKDVQDIWNPFKKVVLEVYNGALDKDTILTLDLAQWSAGVDPMFATITDAVVSYQQHKGTCTHIGDKNATREDLEEAIKQTGALSEMAFRFGKERFMHKKLAEAGADTLGFNMTNWTVFENSLRQLISGWSLSSL